MSVRGWSVKGQRSRVNFCDDVGVGGCGTVGQPQLKTLDILTWLVCYFRNTGLDSMTIGWTAFGCSGLRLPSLGP